MKLFSTNAASLVLERDRRTLAKAMLGVVPDGKSKGQARWRLRTFIDALAAQEARAVNGDAERLSRVDEIEAGFNKLDRQFERLQAEADLEKRRALSLEMQVGKTITAIDQRMQAANKMNLATGELMQIACDKLVGSAMSKLIELCDLWDEVETFCAAPG